MKFGYYWIKQEEDGEWQIALYGDQRGDIGWSDCFGLIEPTPVTIGPFVEPPQ